MQAVFSLSDVVSQLLSLLSIRQFGVNSLDLIMLGVIIFYSYEGYLLGFILALLDFGSFIFAFIIGLVFFKRRAITRSAFFTSARFCQCNRIFSGGTYQRGRCQLPFPTIFSQSKYSYSNSSASEGFN